MWGWIAKNFLVLVLLAVVVKLCFGVGAGTAVVISFVVFFVVQIIMIMVQESQGVGDDEIQPPFVQSTPTVQKDEKPPVDSPSLHGDYEDLDEESDEFDDDESEDEFDEEFDDEFDEDYEDELEEDDEQLSLEDLFVIAMLGAHSIYKERDKSDDEFDWESQCESCEEELEDCDCDDKHESRQALGWDCDCDDCED